MDKVKSRHLVLSAVSVASAAGFAVPAQAFEFEVSGQIDKAMVAADNGEESDVGFVDNNGSNTRFRFTGSQEMGNGLEVGFAYETALTSDISTSFDINRTDTDETFLENRKSEIYLEGNFGRVTLGKGDGASNGTSEVDLSGTHYLGGGAAHYYTSGITFISPDGNPLDATIGNAAYNNFDALSRVNRVRYDSPSLGGLVLSASLDSGHAFETAARYETELANGSEFAVAVDFLDNQNQAANINQAGDRTFNGRFQEYGGSASLLLPSGLNFTGLYKTRDSIGDDTGSNGDTYFGGVGYIIRKHHFQVGWGRTDDLANDGSEGNSYQAAYVYDWRDDIELFASYHMLTLDNFETEEGDSVDGQDINYIYVGSRVKFL